MVLTGVVEVHTVVKVVDAVDLEVEVVLKVEDPGEPEPEPEHPTRLDAMTMSSYQNVFAAEPYDSHPK